ncbi:maltotransferase domain-containing protein [Paraburkholderia caballeronis]|uniref:Alpha-1,4-glucan:maltose-1-phosphate maltosyltransferase n=1 Tax=Paraburkholderia caballeronis TaxID=416943 RepID=A0A1H7KVN1_9BURK|nr:maltotransferase domain-containing protein [Paraburkholderia caballeronis]PXW28175.1 starch synthase (maltosyl-transferring) [Paraburkholderia caballeronis]PXX03541.1 starch synthase (maltosyl-transferring) [Paraburkholderia caballeronis]RAK04285.1 starch synthase (maltosyl-transferring) [Paraburkholderia caballeronis]SED86306.1 starch synthase (maltosyl-transferring) [Paraburkholderia caballeronis]SEK90580.1 starch synthase (maltosyl-transferring) [Paraburkholderia caballeronis]
MELLHAYAPRIYFVHSVLVGPLDAWPACFAHAASLGFDHVLIGALFAPGASGDGRIVADHAQLHPAFGPPHAATADAALRKLCAAAREHGITLLADVVLDRVAANGALHAAHPDWFHPFEPDDARLDPRHGHRDANVAYADFDRDATTVDTPLTAWWTDRLAELAETGIGGFRFDSPHCTPAAVWRQIGDALRARDPQTRLLAATPGLARDEIARLEGAGFDGVFSSLRWWDFEAGWLIDEHQLLRRLGSPIAFPEAPYGTRLVHDLDGAADVRAVERAYRRLVRAAAAFGTGWLVPMGFEYGIADPVAYAGGSPDAYERARTRAPLDLSADIAHANALQRDTWTLQTNGEQRLLSGPGAPVSALLRGDAPDLRDAGEAVLTLVNPALAAPVRVDMARLLDAVPGGFTRFEPLDAESPGGARPRDASAVPDTFALPAGACWLLRSLATPPVVLAPPADLAKSPTSGHRSVQDAIAAPRIAIESVAPSVDHGRFVVKRTVGERVEVSAAIFAEGHDRIDAAVLWRAADETTWREAPMKPVLPPGTDLWTARFPLERVGRYEFVVTAWRDDFASLADHLQKKRAAGQNVDLELQEAQHLLALVLASAETADTGNARECAALAAIVKRFVSADTDTRCAILLAPATAAAVRAARHRPFLSRDPQVWRVDAERSAARFASWYEIFPRSMSDDETRHGTFDDVIAKLPRIRDMGFDVLYFPPIHPIGLANRKGRNNALSAEAGDVGSPYAIGAAEGGHDAVHPQLGTLDDFRRMLAAAHEHGLEIALDFAIQCSPDHPWLKAHPGWFAWRPDGSLRYAENPPKKYQDIVNPEFYAHDAKPALWLALRDVILFWIGAGVRIFRVDNPHTKPLPFWEWMIGDVRARHPDVVFLSEAFTRPRLMYRLAKLGFSQSYTYFTWRESKRDFIDYLTELANTDVRDFYRPNFFVNTPDINPRHLQTGLRASFLIRAALAATLSGLWGVYSGFELCEGRALPGSEEYLDSEKYQLRAWDWNRPGNIVAEIAALNRIRRANPALHTHLGITFLDARNEHVLCFEKATAARDNVVIVAINLDPRAEQGADIELSWQTFQHWGIDDHASLAVSDELTGERFEWRGRWQHVRLDPGWRPYAILRVAPATGLPRDEPDPEPAPAEPVHVTGHPELDDDFPPGGAT